MIVKIIRVIRTQQGMQQQVKDRVAPGMALSRAAAGALP